MITLDILLVTYNQEQYIQQALDGILMQRVNPDVQVRIIVADDCSKDNTLSLIRKKLGAKVKLASENEAEVIYLLTEHNLGIAANYKRAIAATTGEYIAILEGDDYWINAYRLQKHMDVFEQNFDIKYTKNDYLIYNEQRHVYSTQTFPQSNYFGMKELIDNNKLTGNLSSCVFKGDDLRNLTDEVYGNVRGWVDWNIGLALLKDGVAYIIKQPMSVYRLGTGKNVSVEKSIPNEEIQLYKERCAIAQKIAGKEWEIEFQNIIKQRIKSIKNHERYLNYLTMANYISPCVAKVCCMVIPKFFDLLKSGLRDLIPNKLYKMIKDKK